MDTNCAGASGNLFSGGLEMRDSSGVLVTGANGFVGRALCQHLLSKGNIVCGTSRSPNILPSGVRGFVVPNLDSDTNWTEPLEECNTVIHLAARVHLTSDRVKKPIAEFRRVNTSGTINLARQAADMGIKRFIFVSSIGVNGAQTFGVPFRADDIPAPHSDYAISKYEAERGLVELSLSTGMEIVILRPPLVYGKNAPGNFGALVRLVRSGIPLPLGAIANRRSLVVLDNLIDLLTICITHPKAANQIFLVSDGEDLSTTELLKKIGLAVGKPAWLIPVSAVALQKGATLFRKEKLAQSLLGDLQVDISKTCELLNWKPLISPSIELRL